MRACEMCVPAVFAWEMCVVCVWHEFVYVESGWGDGRKTWGMRKIREKSMGKKEVG